jgi:hypothetical protein
MPFTRLEEVERREHWDLIIQWVVILALVAGVAILVREVGFGL